MANATSKVRIVLADDHKILLESLNFVLKKQPDIEVVATVSNGAELMNVLARSAVDVVLMDIQMPELDGFQAAVGIRTRFPQVKILVLSMHNDRSYIERMYELGAAGYLLKTADIDEIIEAIQKVAQGGSYFNPEVVLSFMNRSSNYSIELKLTRRERQVIELIAKENSNVQIAQILNLSVGTINSYRKNLLKKLNVKNTAGLIRFAMNHGILNS